jgi:hypothetical protein
MRDDSQTIYVHESTNVCVITDDGRIVTIPFPVDVHLSNLLTLLTEKHSLGQQQPMNALVLMRVVEASADLVVDGTASWRSLGLASDVKFRVQRAPSATTHSERSARATRITMVVSSSSTSVTASSKTSVPPEVTTDMLPATPVPVVSVPQSPASGVVAADANLMQPTESVTAAIAPARTSADFDAATMRAMVMEAEPQRRTNRKTPVVRPIVLDAAIASSSSSSPSQQIDALISPRTSASTVATTTTTTTAAATTSSLLLSPRSSASWKSSDRASLALSGEQVCRVRIVRVHAPNVGVIAGVSTDRTTTSVGARCVDDEFGYKHDNVKHNNSISDIARTAERCDVTAHDTSARVVARRVAR